MESRECAGRGDLFNLAQALWACSCAVLFYVQSHTGKAMVIFFLKYEQRAHAHTHTHVYSAFTNELNHLIKPTKPIIHHFTSSPSWYWTWGEWNGAVTLQPSPAKRNHSVEQRHQRSHSMPILWLPAPQGYWSALQYQLTRSLEY